MHMEGPWLSTTGKKKGKKKFRNADVANQARKNAESWQAFLDKWDIKPDDKHPYLCHQCNHENKNPHD